MYISIFSQCLLNFFMFDLMKILILFSSKTSTYKKRKITYSGETGKTISISSNISNMNISYCLCPPYPQIQLIDLLSPLIASIFTSTLRPRLHLHIP